MKRIGIWCLTLLLALSLCGCDLTVDDLMNQLGITTTTTTPQPTAPPRETVRVLLKEGWTVTEMAAALEEHRVCAAADFLDAVQNGVYDYAFLADLPTDPQRVYRLEGYLFPDTYEFYVDSDPETVVSRLLRNFEKRIADLLPLLEEKGVTLDEAVIFASLIQGEADTVANMQKVSRVLHNRLTPYSGFSKLQLCSTRDYINGVLKEGDYADAEALRQAYNTYLCKGLPVGAINNPGLDALRAALNPSEDPEILQCYYFATDYKTKTTYFAKTYAEHRRNVEKYGITDIG